MSKKVLYPHKTPSELGKEKRTTTVHDRFMIGCSYCGFLSSEMNLTEALKVARSKVSRHSGKDETITVFDVMAKWGACDTWDPDGKCLHYKR